MRLLTVVTEAPPIRSGIAEVTRQLSAGLRELGHDIEHLTVADVGRRQFGEVRLTGLAAKWGQLRRRLPDYDVVNLHGPAPTFSDAFLGLWRTVPRRRRPVLVYTHHSEIEIKGAGPLCALYNRLHGKLVTVADEVVVTTDSYRRIAQRAGARRVSVVPHGVDASPPSRTRRATRFTVAFVGQLRPYKGIDVLLRAAQMLPDVHFEIAGSGHQGDELHALAESLELRNVRWHGPVSDAEREAILARSHAIALPSTTMAEAFGIVLLEGMRAGAVPIASALPGVRDVAGDTGLLCRPGDPRSLMQAICELRDDPAGWESRSQRSVATAGSYRWGNSALSYHRLMAERILDRHLANLFKDDLQRSMRLILEAALADQASLMLLDPSSQLLRLAAVSGLSLSDQAALPWGSLAGAAGGEALSSGQAVVHPASNEADGTQLLPDAHSAVSIPFSVAGGAVSGVVNLARVKPPAFEPPDISWMERHVPAIAAAHLDPA